ncbi:MAG: single-stranded-DNA-specific exonuclease RecJ [Oscillospiraceae bacterium]|nr:single-stranded-DNA-specific exonuclease RecJ [Oscillospiraceae bacterium]
MKFHVWNIHHAEDGALDRLMEAGYPYLVSGVLASRGVASAEEAAECLSREEFLVHSPFLMADMDKAVARIQAAVDSGEKIAIFGDYDVDGITATCILVDYLKNRGANVMHYIPRRVEDGYGLSRDAIEGLRRSGATLLVTVDCGITGVEEVEFARSLGMDTVVTDHHECKEQLPDAVAVVDPRRADCPYPFKHLAGCGVALKLVLALGGVDREEALFARYCTLAAIGTVADVMPMWGENRTIVSRGLASLERSDFTGLHALLKEAGLAGRDISSVQIGFVLAPRINAAGRMGAADMAADLLLCQDSLKAQEMAKALCALNRERQSVEQEIYSQAEQMIEELPEVQRHALVLSSEQWHQGVVGIVASRLSEKYARPSFMVHISGGVGKGSCRSWGGFNLFAALEHCSDLLLGFGGHELAAGFTIAEENIPAFREKMNEYALCRGTDKAVESALEVDMELRRVGDVTLNELEALSALEPYGSGNARPVFCVLGATLCRAQNVGQNRHLKLQLSKGAARLDGIFFSATTDNCGCREGDRVDAAFYLQINEFRGNRTVQMQLVDLRPSLFPSTREQEALKLLEKFLSGGEISGKESHRLMPSRGQFAAVWRSLERVVPTEGITAAYLPLLRTISAAATGAEPFLHSAFALELFRERGLLELEYRGDEVYVVLHREKKVQLQDSPYLKTLTDLERKGGEA